MTKITKDRIKQSRIGDYLCMMVNEDRGAVPLKALVHQYIYEDMTEVLRVYKANGGQVHADITLGCNQSQPHPVCSDIQLSVLSEGSRNSWGVQETYFNRCQPTPVFDSSAKKFLDRLSLEDRVALVDIVEYGVISYLHKNRGQNLDKIVLTNTIPYIEFFNDNRGVPYITLRGSTYGIDSIATAEIICDTAKCIEGVCMELTLPFKSGSCMLDVKF